MPLRKGYNKIKHFGDCPFLVLDCMALFLDRWCGGKTYNQASTTFVSNINMSRMGKRKSAEKANKHFFLN